MADREEEHTENTPRRQKAHPNLLAGHPEVHWKPGQSGNENGRPPNEGSITYWLKHELAQPNGGGRPVARSIAQKIIAQAKKGNLKAAQEIADRTEGKATQPIDANMTGDVTLTVRYADADES